MEMQDPGTVQDEMLYCTKPETNFIASSSAEALKLTST
jgi:hypothetical protein